MYRVNKNKAQNNYKIQWQTIHVSSKRFEIKQGCFSPPFICTKQEMRKQLLIHPNTMCMEAKKKKKPDPLKTFKLYIICTGGELQERLQNYYCAFVSRSLIFNTNYLCSVSFYLTLKYTVLTSFLKSLLPFTTPASVLHCGKLNTFCTCLWVCFTYISPAFGFKQLDYLK